MLRLVHYIITVQSLINVSAINPPVLTNPIDKVVNFIIWTFSSLFLFIQVNNFLVDNESNIIKILFIENSDYLLFKTCVAFLFNAMNLQQGTKGLFKILTNIWIYCLYENKDIFFHLTFSHIVFTEVVLPWIKIAYNTIILGKDKLLLNDKINRLSNGLYYLSAMYLLIIVIMTRKYRV